MLKQKVKLKVFSTNGSYLDGRFNYVRKQIKSFIEKNKINWTQ